MKLRLFIFLALLLSTLSAAADVLVLSTGKTVEGTILLDNDQVVIIRDNQGSRFQYPKSDVLEIRTGEAEAVVVSTATVEETAGSGRKVSLGVEVRGGAATAGVNRWGGAVGADFLLGSAKIGGREILLGAMVGYEGRWIAGAQAHFLPVQVAARIPLMDTRHAPFVGVNMGYGIGMRGTRGGLHAGAGLGYRVRIGQHSALLLGADVTWQQTAIGQTTTQTVRDTEGEHTHEYATEAHNLVEVGLKLGFLF